MLKRFLKSLVLGLLATLLYTGSVLASWAYIYPQNIIDTSNTTRTNYPILLPFGGQQLINASLISSNGTDTNMQIGASNVPFMMSTTNVNAVIPLIAAGSVTTLNLYTGYSPLQSSFSIIPGSGGNVTTVDNNSLEPGKNATISINNLGATSSTLVNKIGAYSITKSGTTINSTINSSSLSTNISPSGNGSVNSFSVVGAATAWQALLTSDGNTSYVWVSDNGIVSLQQLVAASNMSTNATNIAITGVQVTVLSSANGTYGGGDIQALPMLRTNNASASNGAFLPANTFPNSFSASSYNWTINPVTGLAWTLQDINDLEIGVEYDNLVGANGITFACTQVYATVSYIPAYSLTATVDNSVTHNVSINISGNLTLSVDGVATNTTFLDTGTTIPNNANNIAWLSGIPYAASIFMTVNNTLVLWYQPNVMLIGNSLPDRSGNANTGTINFGANSGLTVTPGQLISFASTQAVANQTAGFSVGAANIPTSWYGKTSNLANLPFYDNFAEISAQTGRPIQGYYQEGIIGLALGAFVVVVVFTRSALMAYLVMLMIFGVGASMGIIPAWIVFALALVGAAIMYLYGQFRLG